MSSKRQPKFERTNKMFRNKEEFLSLLSKVKEISPTQYVACCPAHDDSNPSLSIKFDNGKILLHCFAGCPLEDILNSLNITKSDLRYDTGIFKSAIENTTTYKYYNANGTLSYKKIRYDKSDGSKSFCFRQTNGAKSLTGVQKILYNLPAVIKAETVYFVEGEKCAEAVIKQGYTATTLCTGANSKWDNTYNQYLENKNIIILPDNDEAGLKYAKMLKENLPFAKVILLNDLSEKEDIFDWLKKGHSMEEIKDLEEFDIMSYFNKSDEVNENKEAGKNKTQAEKLINLVLNNGMEFFHDTLKVAYVAIPFATHKEIYPVDSKNFNMILSKLYYETYSKVLKKDVVEQVKSVLSAKALFDNTSSVELSTRVAKVDDNIYYSLSNPLWQAVKINSNGWSIENNPPSIFTRYAHTKSQVIPSHNGDIYKILEYVNISEDYQLLFLCWLVSCFLPNIQHPIPIFHGEKGAAKSTVCKLLKAVIDPSELEVLALPKNSDALIVNFSKHWFLPFDNVSSITQDMSDTLCRAVTGDGVQKRKLFSDNDDCIYHFQRCIAINGISIVANKPDLLDRSILVELSRISKENRKELCVIQENFKRDLPVILGGIFDVLSKAISIEPNIGLKELPRMADFARWGYTIGEAIGNRGEEFINQYNTNIDRQNLEVVSADIVANMMIQLLSDKREWNGTVGQLHTELIKLAESKKVNTRGNNFPQQPNVLSRRLNNLRSNLSSVGITFETNVTSKGTNINIINSDFNEELTDYIIDSKSIVTNNETDVEF